MNQDPSSPKEPQHPNTTWFLYELLSAQNFVWPMCILVCYPQYGYIALPCEAAPVGCFIQNISISFILLSCHMFKTRNK